MSTQDVLERTRSLQTYIAEGRIHEALDEFYAEDVVMQENEEEPVVGLAANREREQAFLDSVERWLGYDVLALAAADDVAFVESTMSFETKGGDTVRMTQVSRMRWRDGEIVEERFYHG